MEDNDQNRKNLKTFQQKVIDALDEKFEFKLEQNFERYEKTMGFFKKYFDQEDLGIHLSRKVDRHEMEQLDLMKADKNEVQHVINIMEGLNNRIKQIAIL